MSSEFKFLVELVKGDSLLINDEFEVKAKDDNGDLVTNFDYEIEKYIIDKIKESYPEFSIVSEEYNGKEGLQIIVLLLTQLMGLLILLIISRYGGFRLLV